MTSEQPLVLLEHARKSFGGTPVLKDISLKVQPGEVVAVIGPSGGGKSTLLRCVNLLETPTDGRIFFEDTEITAKKTDINKVRAKVGMVFQNPDNQIVANVVEEDVAFALENLGGAPGRRSAGGWTTPSRPWACTSTGSTPPDLLSGGQKQPGGHCRCHRYGDPAALCWTSPPPCWTPMDEKKCCRRFTN